MEDWHKYLLALRRDLLKSIKRMDSGKMKVFINEVDNSERTSAEERINVAEIEMILTKYGVRFDA